MTTTKPQSTTEPPCTNSCSGCKNCDHHFYLRDNEQLQCKHCLYSRPVTRFEVDAISLVGQWNYEEPFWWTPIATALAKEFREGQTRAALRQYFCSCGGALTAEEYLTHYFDLGHDRGDPASPASTAPVVDVKQEIAHLLNEDRCMFCGGKTAATTAAPVDHAAIPLLGYERVITIEWDKHNARRHELIDAKRSRPLSDEEVSELRDLQWLAGIKRELGCGPLPAPVEQSDER